jgi:hypothetical protein
LVAVTLDAVVKKPTKAKMIEVMKHYVLEFGQRSAQAAEPSFEERASAGEEGTEEDRYVEYEMKEPALGRIGDGPLCPRMLPNHLYPIPQREPLIRITRNRGVHRWVSNRNTRRLRLTNIYQ